MLHGALRFSDHPRARVLRIDTTRAEAQPEVVSVATAADVPGERVQGLLTRDWRQPAAAGGETGAPCGRGAPAAGGGVGRRYDWAPPRRPPRLSPGRRRGGPPPRGTSPR